VIRRAETAMPNPKRKLAFVLAASEHGTMIVSRLDYRMSSPSLGVGVGYQVLEFGAFDADEVTMALTLLELRRNYFGDGVVAIDCGANVGVHTIEWAKRMTGWGQVLAIEAQERIYYALAGNIAINNCFNAVALNLAISNKPGVLMVPQPNYLVPASYGSLELRQSAKTEYIGQPVDYSEGKLASLQAISIDALNLPRIDFIKLDIEGMEMEALDGAEESVARHRPVILVEAIKSDAAKISAWLTSRGYAIARAGINMLAVHKSDPILPHVPKDRIAADVAAPAPV
jgi:FkbM family methyltransferase